MMIWASIEVRQSSNSNKKLIIPQGLPPARTRQTQKKRERENQKNLERDNHAYSRGGVCAELGFASWRVGKDKIKLKGYPWPLTPRSMRVGMIPLYSGSGCASPLSRYKQLKVPRKMGSFQKQEQKYIRSAMVSKTAKNAQKNAKMTRWAPRKTNSRHSGAVQ